jgi:neutral ceramidase
VLSLVLAMSVGTAYAAEFRAGAGRSEIEITPDMLPLEGLTAQHDPLSVRVLITDDGHQRHAIVVLEQPSVSGGTITGVKASLTKIAKVSAEDAIVVGTHTTSAPHANMGGPGGPPGAGNGAPGGAGGLPPGGAPGAGAGPGPGAGAGANPFQGPGAAAFAKALEAATERAITQANASLRPAKVGYGVGATDINVNRDLPTPNGWAFGSNPSGFSDHSVPVLRIDGADGKPVALLMNVAVRSVVMDGSLDNADNTKAITSDLAGAAAHYVEHWYGGNTVALFIMGAAVDQAPVLEANRYVLNTDGSLTRVDLHSAGFTLLDLEGERLGADVIRASESIKATAKPTVAIERSWLKVPSQGRAGGAPSNSPVLSYTYAAGPDIDFAVVLMRIGDVAIVGVQPELGSIVGAKIKEQSPFPNTMVAVMVDGGAKYMVDADSYDHFSNEARGSQFAKDAAAVATAGIEQQLKQLKGAASGN